MTEVVVELGDVEEFMVQKMTGDDVSTEELVQSVVDNGLWNLYQQWKATDQDTVRVSSGDAQD